MKINQITNREQKKTLQTKKRKKIYKNIYDMEKKK